MKFEANKKYQGSFISNQDCKINIKVLKRTPKTVVVLDLDINEEKRLKISTHEGVEYVKPEGNYSMAPRVRANRMVA